ncbi:MAG: hypothetical protein J5910_10725 [Lachnospiraceae bacterium]|nr:hypothetical protein [Lachnospiraceae bacterium]
MEKHQGLAKMKKTILTVSAAAVLAIALLISGCSSSSREIAKEAVGLSDASVGDIVVFGDIRWYVIARSGTDYTLLCEKPVIKMAYDEAGFNTKGTWEESGVRAWLNEKFYNTFTDEEKALIAKTHNINPDNSEYGTPGGSDTDDHIFLLSVDEANALDKDVLKCGYWQDMDNQWWWLRSPGVNKDYATYVGNNIDKKNVVDPIGDIAGNEFGAVRPALNLHVKDNIVPTSANRTGAEEDAELAAISDSQVGDVVAFGRYTWYVADKTDGICTLLCQGPVAEKAYNDTKTDITWENCSLRRWLNEDFYNSKFTDGEKASIITSHNIFTDADSTYETDCGNDTDDKVYLFSYTESNTVSDYIRDCGVNWWLRSPGKTQHDAVYILGRAANLMGNDVDFTFGVRPSIRVRYSDRE